MSTSTTKVITPVATLSYPHLAEAQKNQDPSKPAKFSACLIFAPGTDLGALKAAAIAAVEAKYPGKAAAMLKSESFRKPFRTDVEDKGYAEGSTFINARSNQKPGVVYAHAEPGTKKPAKMPADKIKEEMYPGSQVRASLTAYCYDTQGNKGVTFALDNLQKVGEGERIDGRIAAENAFEADLSAQPADLSQLM